MESGSFEQLVAMLLAYLGIVVALVLIWAVLSIIANWRIFTKAGEAGWKSIIPIYNSYVAYKIAWKPLMFWIALVVGAVASYAYNASMASPDGGDAMAAVGLVASIVGGILYILFNYKLAKAFGKGIGFTVGLLLLNPVFLLILGFGGAQYQGANQ